MLPWQPLRIEVVVGYTFDLLSEAIFYLLRTFLTVAYTVLLIIDVLGYDGQNSSFSSFSSSCSDSTPITQKGSHIST